MCYNSNTYGSENLASLTVRKTLEHYGYGKKYHGEVETSSNIPNSVGLKSSSAATNSIALATVSALGEKPLDMDVLKIGMEATVESGLSLTGAFDDAYASYFGGGVVADNEKKIVEKILELPGNLQIFVLVPTERSVRVPLDPSKNSAIRTISELAYSQVRKGKIWDALTLNGLAFSSILGNDQRPSLYAIQAGAYGAGLSGKGPAIAAVTNTANAEKVRETLASFGGQLIETRPNFTKAAIEP
jgi:shikimate kinase